MNNYLVSIEKIDLCESADPSLMGEAHTFKEAETLAYQAWDHCGHDEQVVVLDTRKGKVALILND